MVTEVTIERPEIEVDGLLISTWPTTSYVHLAVIVEPLVARPVRVAKMDMPLPSSDDAFAGLIGLLGLGAFGTAIVFLVLLASAIQSWRDTIRSCVAIVRALRSGANIFREMLTTTTPIKGVAAVFITLLVPLGQLLTVGMCFLVGNFISMQFDETRLAVAVQVARDDLQHLYKIEELSKFLQMDWISGGYVLLALAIISRSYHFTRSGNLGKLQSEGSILAWPATILIFLLLRVTLPLTAIFAVLIVGLSLMTSANEAGDTGEAVQQAVTLLVPPTLVLAVCLVYYHACQCATHASLLVVRAWSRDRAVEGDQARYVS